MLPLWPHTLNRFRKTEPLDLDSDSFIPTEKSTDKCKMTMKQKIIHRQLKNEEIRMNIMVSVIWRWCLVRNIFDCFENVRKCLRDMPGGRLHIYFCWTRIKPSLPKRLWELCGHIMVNEKKQLSHDDTCIPNVVLAIRPTFFVSPKQLNLILDQVCTVPPKKITRFHRL